MSKLSDNFVLLEQTAIGIKKIQNMENICCANIRDAQLSKVFKRLKEVFGLDLDSKDVENGYNQLREAILSDNELTDGQKIQIVKQM